MSTPYLGQLSMFAFNFAPRGWALANGQTLPINQNQALFSLLGTTYGGDGVTTFQLPNLQGSVPMHLGGGGFLGQSGGEQNHTLIIGEMPQHTHAPQSVNATANNGNPLNHAPAVPIAAVGDVYGASGQATMAVQMIQPAGGGQGHSNMQPFLVINFCVALQGIFPSRN